MSGKWLFPAPTLGGQKRDNQIQIVDNMSAFGRSRLGLKSFRTEQEAENFLAYCQSYIIRFAFLMTKEELSSLGKKVPDILDYSSQNELIDFAKNIDEQLAKLLTLSDEELAYLKRVVDSVR